MSVTFPSYSLCCVIGSCLFRGLRGMCGLLSWGVGVANWCRRRLPRDGHINIIWHVEVREYTSHYVMQWVITYVQHVHGMRLIKFMTRGGGRMTARVGLWLRCGPWHIPRPVFRWITVMCLVYVVAFLASFQKPTWLLCWQIFVMHLAKAYNFDARFPSRFCLVLMDFRNCIIILMDCAKT